MECSAAIFAFDNFLIHWTYMVHRETFLKIQLQELTRRTPVYGGLLYGRNPVSRFDGSVFSGTGNPVARSVEVNKDTLPTPRFARTSSAWKSPSHVGGVYAQSCLVRQILYTFRILVLEDKIQNRSMCLLRFSLGGNAMDRRSGDGRFS